MRSTRAKEAKQAKQERVARVYAFSRAQMTGIVLAVVFVAVSMPVGVLAATGSFVNIRDYSNTGTTGQARVINNHLLVQQCDPGTATVSLSTCGRVYGGKQIVGDGSGAMTVDGNIQQVPTSPYVMRIQGYTSDTFNPSGNQAVPAGKRFVIETISLRTAIPSGQSLMDVSLGVVTSGVQQYLSVPMVYQGTYSGNSLAYYTGAIAARMYADVGTIVLVQAFRGSQTGGAYVYADLSGYLV